MGFSWMVNGHLWRLRPATFGQSVYRACVAARSICIVGIAHRTGAQAHPKVNVCAARGGEARQRTPKGGARFGCSPAWHDGEISAAEALASLGCRGCAACGTNLVPVAFHLPSGRGCPPDSGTPWLMV